MPSLLFCSGVLSQKTDLVCVCVFSVKMTVNLTTYFLESSNVCVAK